MGKELGHKTPVPTGRRIFWRDAQNLFPHEPLLDRIKQKPLPGQSESLVVWLCTLSSQGKTPQELLVLLE